jgi:hypothetical protein
MDRVVPAGDAYKHQTAGGSDRHPIADLMFGSWNQGFGYSSDKVRRRSAAALSY